MKRNERNRSQQEKMQEEGNLHFRLCHLCFHLNESEEDISDCENCDHVFKDEALIQFWNNNDNEAFSDQLEDERSAEPESEENETPHNNGNVYGLSVRF